ncbi:MAG: cell division ATP-binding protein FtsE [Clostridia bacterium]|nr:cell division ATP-binding protein FtsE [Clostridia bacterium]
MIEFRGVSKSYGTTSHALSDVNLTIQPGEFVFVVGSSGAGKSTLMKLMMREEKPNTGSIYVNGFDLVKMKRKDVPKLRRTMGVIFQDFRLIPTMNVFNNVAFAMRVTGASSRAIHRDVPRALSSLKLGNKARSNPQELSGGEQQRVGIARALVNKPKLLIADEPTGNVDPSMSYEIVALLDEINKRGTTVIMVTHNHELVREFKHRVIMLQEGKIVADNAEGAIE